MESGASVDKILFDFREANIQVSIDDFGTGYSSLSSLKIDKSFVDNLEPDSNDLALCEAMIGMAHKLDLKVIAEGIETAQQRDLLIAAGCDYGHDRCFFSGPADRALRNRRDDRIKNGADESRNPELGPGVVPSVWRASRRATGHRPELWRSGPDSVWLKAGDSHRKPGRSAGISLWPRLSSSG